MKSIRKGINELLKNITQYFKKVKKEHLVREYLKENMLFIAFVITCVLNSTILRFFCMHTIENYLSLDFQYF